MALRAMFGFAFSGGLAAAIGAALAWVVSHALGAPGALRWSFLVASGTFIVYALDRLRDTSRDRLSSPLRTDFVLRNRSRLYAAVGVAGIGFAFALFHAPWAIGLLCVGIGGIGLLHRRLKEDAGLKAAYVSFAWVAACVGIPWLASDRGEAGYWAAGVLMGSLVANLIASNLQDSPSGQSGGFDPGSRVMALWVACGMALAGIVIAMLAPGPLTALVWIPVCEGLALVTFRGTERYGQLAVDGGLFIGAIAAEIHLKMGGMS